MSGEIWRERARRIVSEGRWPDAIHPADRRAVEHLAEGSGYEPYYTLKGVIEGIENGRYRPSRFAGPEPIWDDLVRPRPCNHSDPCGCPTLADL